MTGRLAALIAAAVVVVLAAGSGIAYGIDRAVSSHHTSHQTQQARSANSIPRGPSGNCVGCIRSTATSAPTSTTAAPTPTPPTTAVASGLPGGSWSLPAGKTVQGIVTLGFPQTALGGVSMAYQAVAAEATFDPGILATVDNTVELNPPSNLAEQATQGTAASREAFHLPASGPTSATLAAEIQGCWVQSATATEVTGGFEGQFVESDATTGQQYGQFDIPFAVSWTGSDWRVNVAAANAVKPPASETPPASGISTDGWHSCSGGSN